MKKAAPGCGAAEGIEQKSQELYSAFKLRPQDIDDLRAIWWDQIRLGQRMPAQPGVILIDGGKP